MRVIKITLKRIILTTQLVRGECMRDWKIRCVKSYLKYVSKLHPDNMAFWQQPSDSYDDISSVWYTKTPIGKNNLSTMMVKISKLSKLSRIYTNHSIRATSITEMDEAGIDTQHIMRVSGHKSESSIKHYVERLSDHKKRQI